MYLAEAAEQIDTPYTSALIGMSLNGHADNAGNCQHGQITASKKLMIFWWNVHAIITNVSTPYFDYLVLHMYTYFVVA